ncbi:hypothetical protein YTPLAS73_11500 [Nitrosarchaeum sp.]|nr:hypothetical protein YTPLAS73_11500 [Nitrosarchaeum sp.]
MSEKSKDELIEAQKQIIGMLFEIIKRLQANNELDDEYFQIILSEDKTKKERVTKILIEREENAKIIERLLEQLEI